MRTFSVVTSEEGGELLAEAGYSCRENGYTSVKQRLRTTQDNVEDEMICLQLNISRFNVNLGMFFSTG